jgi:hypothetical protein
MGRRYRTAQGKAVDLDGLILVNEKTIAVGNMGVNARGDELGPGGIVVNTRNQVMDDYYKLNTNSTAGNQAKARDMAIKHRSQGATLNQGRVGSKVEADPQPQVELTNPLELEAEEMNDVPVEPVIPTRARPVLRGSLADSVAKQTVVEQPEINTGQTKGPKRI